MTRAPCLHGAPGQQRFRQSATARHDLITVNVDETVVFLRQGEGLCSDSTPYSRVNSKCGIAPTHLPLSVTPLPATLHRWDTTNPFLREGDDLQINPRRDFLLPSSIAFSAVSVASETSTWVRHAECRWQSAISAFAMRVVSHVMG